MNKSNLPTLVLLPGLLCDESLWQNQLVALSDICNPQVANLTLDSSIAAMAIRVLDNAPERFALAGLSMGGYVAFEIMRRAPERVICLALFDTMARLDEPQKAAQRKGLIKVTENGHFLGVTPKLLPTLIYKDKLDSPVATTVMQMAKQLGKEVFIKQQTAIINRQDSTPTLTQIKVPTWVIVGADDKVTPPAESVFMADTITNAHLYRLPKCGHLAPLELPNETTELLRKWLLAHTN